MITLRILRARLCVNGAFTLIEILVVVAIIGILIALGIPTLTTGLMRTKGAKCASQLHQMGAAIALYQGENDGEFPPAVGGYYPEVGWGGRWYRPVVPASPDEMGLAAYVGGTNELFSLSVCPLNQDKAAAPLTVNPIGYPYVVNYFVMPSLPKPICRNVALSTPSKIIVMLDSVGGPGWGLGVTGNLPPQGGSRIQESHFGKANILWADGHVSASKKSDITYYNINRTISTP